MHSIKIVNDAISKIHSCPLTPVFSIEIYNTFSSFRKYALLSIKLKANDVFLWNLPLLPQ